jgi:hypothetical protein
MPSARVALSLALLAACNSTPDPAADESSSDPGETTSDPSPTSTPAPTSGDDTTTAAATTDAATTDSTTADGEPALTYWRDTKAILDAKCATCHRANDIAPFALTTYEESSQFAPVLAAAIEAGTMPPWHPDDACNGYKHDRSLSDEDREKLLAWIDLGAPEGDPGDAPPLPPDDGGEPVDFDLELGIPEPFTPTVLPDDYRCFLLDWPAEANSYATAFTIEPGARSIVHHVIAFIIPPDELPAFEALDDADPGPGYPCYGGPGGEASPRARWLGAWVPGSSSNGALPAGTGIRVDPGSKIALQMHYHPLGDDTSDLSVLRVRTEPTVERPAYLLPLANPGWMTDQPEMTIPAGAPDTVHEFTIGLSLILQYLYGGDVPGFGEPLLVHAAGVHMHTRGQRASLNVIGQGGSPGDCLIDVRDYDFNWQGIYDLKEPVLVNTADQVRLECHFDNSAGDTPMKWGEGTGDEMCLGMLYVSAPGE